MTDGASHGQIAQHGRASYYDDAVGLEMVMIHPQAPIPRANKECLVRYAGLRVDPPDCRAHVYRHRRPAHHQLLAWRLVFRCQFGNLAQIVKDALRVTRNAPSAANPPADG